MKTHLHRFGYTTACGIKVDPQFHVNVNDVTCGNCQNTRAFRSIFVRSSIRGCAKRMQPDSESTMYDTCKHFKDMDKQFNTPANSPLHHDNRCQVCLNDPDHPGSIHAE